MGDYRTFKARLRRGETLYGPFIHCNSAPLLEVLGQEGFDFVIVDMEHGATDVATAQDLVRSANAAWMAATVRVPGISAPDIVHALDMGAQAVMVPQVSSAEAARVVVEAARFAPLGMRGVDPYARSAGYGYVRGTDYFERANQDTLLIVQVEGAKGVERLDEICSVPGIDCVFIGPYDLSQSLGVTGDVTHPKVVEKVQQVVKDVAAAGLVVGIFADDAEKASMWADAGVRYVSVSMDVAIFRAGARALRDALGNE